MCRCGLCGGTLIVKSRGHGKQRAFSYACSSFELRGKVVCPNSLKMRLEVADDAILSALERELLDPEILQEAAARAARRVAAPARTKRCAATRSRPRSPTLRGLSRA